MGETIAEIANKIKQEGRNILLVLIIVLLSLAAFGLGRLSVGGGVSKRPIEESSFTVIPSGENAPKVTKVNFDTKVVASKNGTKYHYTWCSGASKILEANKIEFQTAALAESAGYTLAANCK